MLNGMAKALRLPSMLVALLNRVAFVGPVLAKIVGQIENLQVGKPHLAQFCECRSEVRTAVQWTAPTIEHNELLARECDHAILQLLDTRWLRTRRYVFRTGDMRLGKEHTGTNLQNQWLVRSFDLLQLNQRFRFQPLSFGDG